MSSKFIIIYKDLVSSTNDEAKRIFDSNIDNEFLVIYANEQSAGRGQRENIWHSLPGKNLTFSIACSPEYIEISNQFYLSKVISIGLLNYLKLKIDDVKIKWPNDIYCNEKKISGILIENSISLNKITRSIIGIGLNLNQTLFPEYLNNATSLSLISGNAYDVIMELNILLGEISKSFQFLKSRDYKTVDMQYHSNLYKIFTESNFSDALGPFTGKIIGTQTSGNLIIEDETGKLKIYAYKEVEFI